VDRGLAEIAEAQESVVTRQQAGAAGVPFTMIRSLVRTGQWQRLARGVYATFTGPVPRAAWLWAAVLAAGDGAVLSHETAAELYGLLDGPSDPIHVTVPSRRRTVPPRGVRHHRSDLAARACHPTRRPPRTRIEDTVLDLADAARDAEQAVSWVLRACGRRLTTAARLSAAMAARARVRRRAVLSAAVQDAGTGCHSLLELDYLRRVERAHGLPTGERQSARRRRGGRWYDDVRYDDFDTVVELDGSAAHPFEARGRDNLRDNAGAAVGLTTLRYRFDDVVARPCQVARQVATVLHHHGWAGAPRRCGPGCEILET
jgi:predicted transcriptional regulator of viral defense system